MTLLMYCCNKGDRESVELLLRYGADINQVIKVVNKHGVMTFRTPFSVSIGSADIEFVTYIVNQGADPLKAMNLMNEVVAKFTEKPFESNLNLIPTMGSGEIPVEIREGYLSQVYSIMEQYYLKELLANYEFSAVHAFEEEKESKKVKELSQHSISSSQKKGVQEQVAEYINFKKLERGFLKKDSATTENTFDILLLEFCQNGSEKILEQIHEYMALNPELNHYAIRSILESREASGLAHEVFRYAPALLHKFFTLKKQLCDSSLQQKKVSIVPEGAYEVQSNLTNTVYVSITPDLKEQLKERSLEIFNKFSQKLSDCRFIKSDSNGISGIKTYKGVIKLKIAGEDISIVTKQKYLEKATGNILIIFDKIYTHKDKAGQAVTTHEVVAFDEVWSRIGVLDAESQGFIEAALGEDGMALKYASEEQSPEIIGEAFLEQPT